jgi:CAAX prenyl protease-like protein
MWALDPFSQPRSARLFADTPLPLLAVMAASAAATWALVEQGVLPTSALRLAGVTAGHGALLATALSWAGVPASSCVAAVALLGLAACAAAPGVVGPIAYLAPVLWIVWLTGRGRLADLGLGARVSLRALLMGAAVGGLLGAHLLVSASRTFGLHVRLDHPTEMLGAIGYDVGANVLAAECFFRGALFNRALGRWSFATATIGSTLAYVVRYLVDPLLPKSAGLVVGAVFYLALLGALNCWLFRWSESLLPGFLGALVFFAAYRALATG